MSRTPRLAVRDVRKCFGPHAVLDDIALSVQPGEVVAITGSNGSGKSTLLRCIAGLASYEGVIEIDGRPAHRMRASVGYMPQSVGLAPWATIAETIGYFVRLRECANTDVPLGLLPRPDLPIRVLSGGQRQRVALAIALLGAPSLLLLDEPAANLDDDGRRALKAVIEERSRSGASVLIATPFALDLPVHATVTIREGRIHPEARPSDERAERSLRAVWP
ncbi:MAG: ATP-binding cassette domain-containing protein [Acidimicrobiia bacterium]